MFDQVSFKYDGGSEVLSDLSFTIRQGETVAILGATGTGKSTIALLLQRLYKPQNGSITIAGVAPFSLNFPNNESAQIIPLARLGVLAFPALA